MFIPDKPAGAKRRPARKASDQAADEVVPTEDAADPYSLAHNPVSQKMDAGDQRVPPEAFWKTVARFARLR